MSETVTVPEQVLSDLEIKEGERANAVLEVTDGNVVISITSRVLPSARKKRQPNFLKRLKTIYGDKEISGSNPVLEEREQARW